jgi:hypothetical protein
MQISAIDAMSNTQVQIAAPQVEGSQVAVSTITRPKARTFSRVVSGSGLAAIYRTDMPTAGRFKTIEKIHCSYQATPTAGVIRVWQMEADGTTRPANPLYSLNITAAGPCTLDVNIRAVLPDRRLEVEIGAGGTGVFGTINVTDGEEE